MTYQHEFVMKLSAEYEKNLEFTVCAVVQPNWWVSWHMRLTSSVRGKYATLEHKSRNLSCDSLVM